MDTTIPALYCSEQHCCWTENEVVWNNLLLLLCCCSETAHTAPCVAVIFQRLRMTLALNKLAHWGLL